MPSDNRDAQETYPFTAAELERLYAFKQAVLAGFYSDQLHDEEAQPVAHLSAGRRLEDDR
jgi:hypothetical protein